MSMLMEDDRRYRGTVSRRDRALSGLALKGFLIGEDPIMMRGQVEWYHGNQRRLVVSS